MALAPKTPAVAKTRVRVTAGRTVYLAGSTHPFRPGDEFDVPQNEAVELIAMGHVFDPSKQQPSPAAPDEAGKSA